MKYSGMTENNLPIIRVDQPVQRFVCTSSVTF